MPRLRASLVAAVLTATACGGGGAAPDAGATAPATIEVSSLAFDDGGAIPPRSTCDGDDVHPPLAWSGVPEGTESIALSVVDLDAPGGAFVHWLVVGVPPDVTSLREGEVPDGAVQGETGFDDTGYRGPCPPPGDAPHRYVFTVYALDGEVELGPSFPLGRFDAALDGAVLARGELTGTYGR